MGYDDGGDEVSGGVLCNARGYDDGGGCGSVCIASFDQV